MGLTNNQKHWHSTGFHTLVAKTGPADQPGWLPLWAHLQGTKGIMEHLLSQWTPERIGPEIPSISNFPDSSKTRHGLADEAILLHLGCPSGIASVVGAHHGKPGGITSVLDYEENFYGLQGAESDSGIRWETIWQEWFIFALQQCGYTDISQLPQLNLSCQVLLSGLLIMADWIASNTTYFPLLALDDSGHTLPYPLKTQEAWARLSLPGKWEPTLFSMDSETFHHRFGFVFNSVQQTVLQTVKQSFQPGIHISGTQMEVGKTEAALGGAELLASKMGCGGIFFGLPTQATSNGIFPRLK